MGFVQTQRSILFLLLTGLFAFGSFYAGAAFAGWNDDYGGWGHFTTSNITWCHIGTDWLQNSQAASKWSADTDLSITNNCNSEIVTTSVANYGNTGWAGYAYICSFPYCNNSTAWNNNYSSCEARSNSYLTSSWSFAEKQFNATHELGHCWSLGHRVTTVETDSVMRSGQLSITNPNGTDEQLVNDRH